MRLFLAVFSCLVILSSHCLSADQDPLDDKKPNTIQRVSTLKINEMQTQEQFQVPLNPMHYHGSLHRGIVTAIGTCTTFGLFTAVLMPTLSLGFWYYILG